MLEPSGDAHHRQLSGRDDTRDYLQPCHGSHFYPSRYSWRLRPDECEKELDEKGGRDGWGMWIGRGGVGVFAANSWGIGLLRWSYSRVCSVCWTCSIRRTKDRIGTDFFFFILKSIYIALLLLFCHPVLIGLTRSFFAASDRSPCVSTARHSPVVFSCSCSYSCCSCCFVT